MPMHRRSLLACLPIAIPAAAQAFRLEPPSAEVAAEYGAGCPAEEGHAALEAELAGMLGGRPLPPEMASQLGPELARLARCSFCGCAVTGAADHGEATPREG
jgi:hypothetical protein